MDDTTFWTLAIFIFIIVIFILWLFFGGHEYQFTGLNFLNINDSTNKPIDNSIESSDESSSDNETACNDILVKSMKSQKESNSINSIGSIDKIDLIKSQKEIKHESSSYIMMPTVIKKLPSLDLNYYLDNDIILKKFSNLPKKKHMKPRKTANESRGEQICRNILQVYFDKPFVSIRPDFLVNTETNVNLELDCFNEELNLALEYNGYQHYVFPNKFHKTLQDFEDQRRRDDLKVRVCERLSIYLIVVPYDIPYDRLPKYIEYFLPENVKYRRDNGIEDDTSNFYEDDNNSKKMKPKHGFI